MHHTFTFFGYGSLVNTGSHTEAYENPTPAKVEGWARTWRQDASWPYAILTAIPAPDQILHGLTASLPGADWSILDAREAGYDRVMTEVAGAPTAIYTIPESRHANHATPRPILLSYLDVVVQGYHQVYGERGVADFFATTSRWETPVLNDRAKPLYPRAQILTKAETQLVDSHLNRLSARVDQL
ncbi:MAG: gamma-glutamylcyclotransferase family protein [Pseudomonadota bacterium]